MPAVTSAEHLQLAGFARKHLATYEKAHDLVNIGAYADGSDPDIDAALRIMPLLNAFLQQDCHEITLLDETLAMLQAAQMVLAGPEH
jgi:flagellum-specific ATP synthase